MKSSGKMIAGIATGVVATIVSALMLAGPFNLLVNRLPDGLYGWSASHWQAGQPGDCRLCPDRLFVVICDADKHVHLRSLQQLAALQAEYLRDKQGWSQGKGEIYSCIGNRSFRLARPSGSHGGPYDADDPGFREDVSFQVLRETAAAQVVEVRYKDSRADIDDALFRYEIRDGTINPLESWILTQGHRSLAIFGVMAALALLALSWAACFAIAAVRRFLASRRHGSSG